MYTRSSVLMIVPPLGHEGLVFFLKGTAVEQGKVWMDVLKKYSHQRIKNLARRKLPSYLVDVIDGNARKIADKSRTHGSKGALVNLLAFIGTVASASRTQSGELTLATICFQGLRCIFIGERGRKASGYPGLHGILAAGYKK